MSSRVLRRGSFLANDWTLLADGPGGVSTIVPLDRWRKEREALLSAGAAVGVLLPNTVDVDAVYPELAERPLIALEFPTFADGRALSQAVVLRSRLGFTGELRAVGDIIRDLICWLGRCGFDTIVPRQDQDLEACRLALSELGVSYQAAADGRIPAWIERRAGAAP